MKTIAYTIALVFLSLSLSAQWNQKDSQGRKIGKWKQYHVNGKIRYTGQFVDGYPDGTFTYYNSAGSMISKLQYSDSGRVAKANLFYPDGKRKAEGTYVDKKKDGLWKFYHQRSGAKRAEEAYKMGVRHGVRKVYFANGKLAVNSSYQDGILHGTYHEFYDNGDPKIIATFVKGKYNGTFMSYYRNRVPMKKGMYIHGKKDGQWIYYTSSGRVQKKEKYDKGKKLEETVLVKEVETPTDSIGDPKNIGRGRF